MQKPAVKRSILTGFALVMTMVGLISCSTNHDVLALAPNVLVGRQAYPEAALPPALRNPTAKIFFVTDRKPNGTSELAEYSSERSRSMAFGSKTVRIGEGLSWPDLMKVSISQAIRGQIELSVLNSQELLRFPPTPLPLESRNGRLRLVPDAVEKYHATTRAFQKIIAGELRRANRREAIIYVHGVRNSFEDGAATITNLWHYSGRIGVPIVYSWPADSAGAFFGYFSDRESGDFSVYHFKEFIRMLVAIPSLENIHIIAHSRGNEVATAALRELMIAERAAGREPRNTLKIETLVMAAPDLSFDVVEQRLMAEKFAGGLGQITIYSNPTDGALRLSQRLQIGKRLGRLSPRDIDHSTREILSRAGNVNFVNVEEVTAKSSHGYFRTNVDVVSDIVLTLQTSALPGGPERPLDHVEGPFWNMHAGYPYDRPPPPPPEREQGGDK